jgi:hypothetical protein
MYDPVMEQESSSFDAMTDTDLMSYAKLTLAAASEEPPGSDEQAEKLARHELIITELKRRLVNHVNARMGLPKVRVPDAALSGINLTERWL